jgi:hypothetical protein
LHLITIDFIYLRKPAQAGFFYLKPNHWQPFGSSFDVGVAALFAGNEKPIHTGTPPSLLELIF